MFQTDIQVQSYQSVMSATQKSNKKSRSDIIEIRWQSNDFDPILML